MRKVAADGPAYVAREAARLGGLLESHSITPEKKTLFAMRRNILAAFADPREL